MGQALFNGTCDLWYETSHLPGRETLILTHDKKFEADGIVVVHDVGASP